MSLDDFKDKLVFDHGYDVLNWIEDCIRHAEAHRETSRKLTEAHDYVQKYCMPEGWGENVWHTILKDAIKLRKIIGTTIPAAE